VWEISYSKQEILPAQWIDPGGFSGVQTGTLFNRLSNLFERGDGRSWNALGIPETARSTGRYNHRQGLLFGEGAWPGYFFTKIYIGWL
jgi:hypothetical protein